MSAKKTQRKKPSDGNLPVKKQDAKLETLSPANAFTPEEEILPHIVVCFAHRRAHVHDPPGQGCSVRFPPLLHGLQPLLQRVKPPRQEAHQLHRVAHLRFFLRRLQVHADLPGQFLRRFLLFLRGLLLALPALFRVFPERLHVEACLPDAADGPGAHAHDLRGLLAGGSSAQEQLHLAAHLFIYGLALSLHSSSASSW